MRNLAKKSAKNSIIATKLEFEKSFLEGEYYNKQTQDQDHLQAIMELLPINDGMRILDLGTGSGYLSFPLAKKYPNTKMIGLDIVEKTLQQNKEKAKHEKLSNLSFVVYDGVVFPFEEESFDMVISRYALHHFPLIEKTFSEIARVLKPEGKLFVSDPAPNDDDKERFVDAYMQMKKDGHIKFYSKKEWMELAGKIGLHLENQFDTAVRFPKKRSTAMELEDILKKHDPQVVQGYQLAYTEEDIYITEKVNNMLFSS